MTCPCKNNAMARHHGKAGLCVLLCKICKSLAAMAKGMRFTVGTLLFLANWLVGYGGILACASLAVASGNGRWLYLGMACYGLSWLMLAASMALLGREAFAFLRGTAKRKARAWKEYRRTE